MEKLASGTGGWKAQAECAGAFLCVLLASTSTRAHAQDKELVVMVEESNLSAWDELLALARDFERANEGVHVRPIELGGAAGSQDKVKFLLAGDVQLDLVRIDIQELAAFVAEGALLDLEPYFAADRSFVPSAYFDSTLAAIRDPRGHLYGLPSTFTPYVMYANLDLLERAGIARPGADWTWEDFHSIAVATTRDDDGDGEPEQYGVSLTQWLQAVAPWIWQNGGEFLAPDGQHSLLGEPAAVEALEFLQGLLHREHVASFDASFANQLSQGLFQAGRAALYGPVGYWETYRFKSIRDFRWDVLPLPRGERAATAVAMTVYVVPRTSRHPELAYRFLRELAGPRYQRVLAEIGNGVPGLREIAFSPSFLKPDVAPESEHVFLDVMGDARFLPPLSNWRKIESLVQAELEGVLVTGAIAPAEAGARMASKTDAFLAREAARHALPRLARGTIGIALAACVLGLLAFFLARRGRAGPRRLAGEERAGYALILPWAIGFVAFLFGPAVVTFVLSLAEWSPLRPLSDARWLGSANYARLFADPTFGTSVRVTAIYALASVPLGLGIALGLALLLRSDSRLASAVRTLVYLPAVISPVIVAAVWRFLLDADQGWIDARLATLGIAGPAWLRDPGWVQVSFVLLSVWGIGAQMLVFLAALKALDPSLEEAARVDGAGAWARFVHVILPSLSPVVLFNLVTGTILAVQIFTQPYVMTHGGPGDASRYLILYLFESAFLHLDMGYASAIAWVVFVVLAILCGCLLGTARRWVHYAARTGA
jgi:multiple sugar transport system permease protein